MNETTKKKLIEYTEEIMDSALDKEIVYAKLKKIMESD